MVSLVLSSEKHIECERHRKFDTKHIDHKHIYLFIICSQFLLNESHTLHLIIVHEQSPIAHIWWGGCYLMIFPNKFHVFVIQTHTYYERSPKKVVIVGLIYLNHNGIVSLGLCHLRIAHEHAINDEF
mgnify:CR=1 FL=1